MACSTKARPTNRAPPITGSFTQTPIATARLPGMQGLHAPCLPGFPKIAHPPGPGCLWPGARIGSLWEAAGLGGRADGRTAAIGIAPSGAENHGAGVDGPRQRRSVRRYCLWSAYGDRRVLDQEGDVTIQVKVAWPEV